MKRNIKRLMECVKSVGGEVFFGECDPTAAGYTVIDKPFVKAAPYDKDEEMNERYEQLANAELGPDRFPLPSNKKTSYNFSLKYQKKKVIEDIVHKALKILIYL